MILPYASLWIWLGIQCQGNLYRMKTCTDIANFIERQDHIVRLLETVDALSLPDCWIGAGVIRNAIWDHLHDRKPRFIPGSDVDVVYFDSRNATRERDETIEAHLNNDVSDVPWSVHNQALMHFGNGDKPYRDTKDALRHWPETATAIGARIRQRRIEVLAPFDVEDLITLVVRPTPAFVNKMDIYQARIAVKFWKARWPKLSLLEC